MRTVIGYILTPFFYFTFIFFLLIFHPIQWVSYKVFGYKAHKRSVDALNFCLTYSTLIMFNVPIFRNRFDIPTDRPIIFISNHQSTYEIPGLIYFLRKHHGKFISKIELAKSRMPSIAFNLKYGGAANIDRKNQEQSMREINKLAERMKTRNWSAFIFPEGTRSKDGKMKKFKAGGIIAITKICPDVLIVPIAIKGSYKMVQKGMFPLLPFHRITWDVLEPVEIKGRDINEVIEEVENSIKKIVEG